VTPDAARRGTHDPLDPAATLRFALFGPHDPTGRLEGGLLAKAWQTPEGPVTLALSLDAAAWEARAWGPGAAWAIARADDLTGAKDARDGWPGDDPQRRALDARHRGVRLLRLPWRAEALAAIVLQQRVRFADAARGWNRLVAAIGEPAPGPLALRVLPPWSRLQATAPGAWLRLGIDAARAQTLHDVAWLAATLDPAPHHEAPELLVGRRGLGPWSRGMFAGHVLGDADAVIPGDVHLPRLVATWLGLPGPTDDDAMITALEPHRPHRFRIVRRLIAS
jgi:3-methyladenine DNA glycosylase/8-oxoguanine DNA glycosylase